MTIRYSSKYIKSGTLEAWRFSGIDKTVAEENKSVKMSFYIDEETRTRFKLACTATGISMNQALTDLVNGWLESNDPFKKSPQQNEPPAFNTAGAKGTGGKGRGKKGQDG